MRDILKSGLILQPQTLGDNCLPLPEIEETESSEPCRESEDPFCTICYKPLGNKSCQIQKCKHNTFCFDCLTKYIVCFTKVKCPICRGFID